MTYWRGWGIAGPPPPKIPALPRIIWEEEPVREPAVTRASAIAALDAQAAMFMAEKASREDYIIDLRAKLKRAGEECGLYAHSLEDEIRYRHKIQWREANRVSDLAQQLERDRVLATKDIEQGQAAIAKLRGVQEDLATAKVNAESLDRGLPAAVEAATAQLTARVKELESDLGDMCHRYRQTVETLGHACNERDDAKKELVTTRHYVCDLITDRDAARKERDEAVAAAERWGGVRGDLAVAKQHRDILQGLLNIEQAKLSPLLQENEKLRKLSSEACAEREQLRAKLDVLRDALVERNNAMAAEHRAKEHLTDAHRQLRGVGRIDQILADYASGSYRARDVVKELCRLRGIS